MSSPIDANRKHTFTDPPAGRIAINNRSVSDLRSWAAHNISWMVFQHHPIQFPLAFNVFQDWILLRGDMVKQDSGTGPHSYTHSALLYQIGDIV